MFVILVILLTTFRLAVHVVNECWKEKAVCGSVFTDLQRLALMNWETIVQ